MAEFSVNSSFDVENMNSLVTTGRTHPFLWSYMVVDFWHHYI